MKRNIKNTLLLFLAGAVSLVSCDGDFDEINRNPNKTDQFSPVALFNASTRTMMSYPRDVYYSAKMERSWMQYTALTAYTYEAAYYSDPNSLNGLWVETYLALSNYKKMIQVATDPKQEKYLASEGDKDLIISAARIMMAYNFNYLAETFGDVPYYSYGSRGNEKFQGLNPANTLPIYTAQEDIYKDILKELKEVAETIKGKGLDGGAIFKKNGDFVLGSKIKAYRFANSLRFRIANKLKNVADSELKTLAQNTINELKGGSELMQSHSDSVGLQFENGLPNYSLSPIYNDYYTRLDYAPSALFVSLLKGEKVGKGDKEYQIGNVESKQYDPRLQKIASPVNSNKEAVMRGMIPPTEDLSKYNGMPYGVPNEDAAEAFGKGGENTSIFSGFILRPDFTEYFMEYAEVCFLLSENNGWDQEWYEKGVRASMERWEVEPAKIDKYMAEVLSTKPANEENVLVQKYIALFSEPEQGWSEYRRTGYPKFLLKPGEKGLRFSNEKDADGKKKMVEYTFESEERDVKMKDVPSRKKYPTKNRNLNRINCNNAIARMFGGDGSLDRLDGKLIFDGRQ